MFFIHKKYVPNYDAENRELFEDQKISCSVPYKLLGNCNYNKIALQNDFL